MFDVVYLCISIAHTEAVLACFCIVVPLADCTEQPPSNTTRYTCTLPAASGSSCTTAQCELGYEQGVSGTPRATCSNGRWTLRNSCVQVLVPPPQPPAVTYQTAQLSLTLSFTGSCSQQATGTLANGLTADMQQLAATLPATTAAVTQGACASGRRRAAQVRRFLTSSMICA
jgi:hypothetical protein